jgi:hypothetical protein
MTDTTALLISKDRALIATCERAIDAIPVLRLEVVSELCEAGGWRKGRRLNYRQGSVLKSGA